MMFACRRWAIDGGLVVGRAMGLARRLRTGLDGRGGVGGCSGGRYCRYVGAMARSLPVVYSSRAGVLEAVGAQGAAGPYGELAVYFMSRWGVLYIGTYLVLVAPRGSGSISCPASQRGPSSCSSLRRRLAAAGWGPCCSGGCCPARGDRIRGALPSGARAARSTYVLVARMGMAGTANRGCEARQSSATAASRSRPGDASDP